MTHKSHRLQTCIAAFLLASVSFAQAATVTVDSLLRDMVNRELTTIHPNGRDADFTLHQISSYDRRTHPFGEKSIGLPAGLANIDFSNFIREEQHQGRTEFVMMEEDGPGAIVHIWCAGGHFGNVRIYLDGADDPVYEGPVTGILGKGGIAQKAFGSPLAFQTRKGPQSGLNLQAPITFAKHCKITYDKRHRQRPRDSNNFWYNVNFIRFAEGTAVETFTQQTPDKYRRTIETANKVLNDPTKVFGKIDQQKNDRFVLPKNGGTQSIPLTQANQAIRKLATQLKADNIPDALKQVWIEIDFDGQRRVSGPIGHFFGTGDQGFEMPTKEAESWSDWFRTIHADGRMETRWVMPYRQSAEVRFINHSTEQSVALDCSVSTGAYAWREHSMYFHANYREEYDIKGRGVHDKRNYNGPGTGDFNYLIVQGRGVYVGDSLAIRNGAGAGDHWWGEGDEKIYVDGEKFPSFIGTGTEDYYCYAWAHPDNFISPWVTQPRGSGNLAVGESINSRVRLLDVHPFETDYRFDIEIWCWRRTDMDYRSIAFWYGMPDAKALRLAADAQADFAEMNAGAWSSFASSHANPSATGAVLTPLKKGQIGTQKADGFGGDQSVNGTQWNLPGVSDAYLFGDGSQNIDIQGKPGYHELQLHPGEGAVGGTQRPSYVVLRWTASEDDQGKASLLGSIRNFIEGGDGVDFAIYHKGERIFSAAAKAGLLPEHPFDLNPVIQPGDTLDFVLGNNGKANATGDESTLRVQLYLPEFKRLKP